MEEVKSVKVANVDTKKFFLERIEQVLKKVWMDA